MTTVTAPLAPTVCRVLSVRRDTPNVRTLKIAPPSGASWRPGMFSMLYAFGVGEVPISASGIDRHGVVSHTVRSVGAVTAAICRLRKGDAIGVRGPLGVGWPVEEAIGHDVLLVAGGLGMAPLRSALQALVVNRHAYGRVALVYATRSVDSVLYLNSLERTAARNRVDLHMTLDQSAPRWRYDVGPITPLLGVADVDLTRTIAMTCGPEAMMRFVASQLRTRGMAEEQMYVSLERNMACGVGLCGHCQLGPTIICRDGPVYRYDRVADLMARREQ